MIGRWRENDERMGGASEIVMRRGTGGANGWTVRLLGLCEVGMD